MMKRDAKIVAEGYNKIGSVYNEWAKTVRVAERDKYIRKVKELCPRGGKVLDVGCGNGRYITSHLAKDFQVLGIDISDYQISEARKNVPEGEFICGDVRDCNFEPATVDAIVSFYCFTHIGREGYPGLLSRFHEWLKLDGCLVASFGINNEKEWIGEWLGARTFFSSHSRETTLALIDEAGFRIESAVVETEIEDGEEASFLWIIARKQASQKETIEIISAEQVGWIEEQTKKHGWLRDAGYFDECFAAQQRGELTFFLSRTLTNLNGYVKLLYTSKYPPFREQRIPEINDLGVMPNCRRRGVASRLMNRAEDLARTLGPVVGLGVGLHPGYAPAQRMYVLRGYVPDGLPLFYKEQFVAEYQDVCLDDDLTMHLTKTLAPPSEQVSGLNEMGWRPSRK